MTEQVKPKRRSMKDLISPTTELFDVFKDEDGFMRLQFIQGKMFVHYDSYRFGVDVYRRSMDKFNEIADMLKAQGVDELYSCVPDDEKTRKFQTLFGFEVHAENMGLVLFKRVL